MTIFDRPLYVGGEPPRPDLDMTGWLHVLLVVLLVVALVAIVVVMGGSFLP